MGTFGKGLRSDALEFAPGLLSIQDSPPAKLPRIVLFTTAALFAILLAWAIFGKLDIVASAEGRLVPQSYVKIVQPAEGGIIQEITVRDGQAVEAGQVLIRMDAKLTESDARTLKNELALKSLQVRRIDAELSGRPMTARTDDRPSIYAQVNAQYRAHRQSYLDALAEESSALEKARHDLHAAKEVLTKIKQVLPSYRKSADAYQKLKTEGFVSVMAAEEKHRDRIEKEQDLLAQESTTASLLASIAASEKRLAQITSSYRSELQNERIETEAQLSKLREDSQKLSHKANLLELKASQAGIVKDLATHTRGTVVSPGAVLMNIVPKNDPLEMETLINNQDVAFVHMGQRVKIKLAAYPFQKYGMIDGSVIHVGPDTSEGTNALPKPGQDKAQQLPGLRYKALVALDTQYLNVDGKQMQLTPGMEAVAEIQQGQRTVMEYLLSPVRKAWHEAARER